MSNHYDHTRTPIHTGDWVTHIDPINGSEKEGEIVQCLENNHVILETESGNVTVNASDTYVHP